ncbi:MAG: AAA family ATPase [Oscillospiraceae bacterium]|nr:AAA family ATPase [Oscillospiraceae bacterium]
MQDVFITKIHIDKVRHLKDVSIALSDTERKHLILTGKNGSGKTSLLEAMKGSLDFLQRCLINDGEMIKRYIIGELNISYSRIPENYSELIGVYISAYRNKFILPNFIEKVKVTDKTSISENVVKSFLKHIISLDYTLVGARADNNIVLAEKLDAWFKNFKLALQCVYDCPELEFQMDREKLRMIILIPGLEPFALNQMASGYKAFLKIYMELIMRLEEDDAVVDYNKPAIVLIDEIETHLHVELQKRVLPFLTKMFPNVQFIVTTHSPFVITSLENAVVYDLEKRERLDSDLTIYSYESIVESFLNTNVNSKQIMGLFEEYRKLARKGDSKTKEDVKRLGEITLELYSIPPTAATELSNAFEQIESERVDLKNISKTEKVVLI